MSYQLEVLMVALAVSVTTALPGNFLVLRKMSMISDAISHSVLFGIAVGFLIFQDLASPFLILGATLTGLLTVYLTERLVSIKVKEDASIGLVFPLLFALGVIIITLFSRNVHLDIDAVLTGELIVTPFKRQTLFFTSVDLGPTTLWVMIGILLVNVLFIVLFYKELKLSTFDRVLASSFGFMPWLIHYLLMGMVSITLVGAFDAAGSILVVSFMIVPPSTAFLISKQLDKMILNSIFFAIINAVIGFYLGFLFDVSIAGAISVTSGVVFLVVFGVTNISSSVAHETTQSNTTAKP